MFNLFFKMYLFFLLSWNPGCCGRLFCVCVFKKEHGEKKNKQKNKNSTTKASIVGLKI